MSVKHRWSVIGSLAAALAAGLVVYLCSAFDSTPGLAIDQQTQPHPVEPEDAPPKLPPLAYFHDVTAKAGIDFTARTGEDADHYTLLESLGSGVALFDFDGDGLVDIFFVGGGTFGGQDNKEIRGLPGKLYKNLGNGKFQDVTAAAGLDQAPFYAHGCAVADYDCDGWPDLLVTGYGGLALYHNEPDPRGGRRFAEVAHAAGLRDTGWCTSAAWGDLDGDGYPDLYICRYVDWSWATHKVCRGDHVSIPRDICPPMEFKGSSHLLYRNNGNGTLTDVSAEAGLRQHGPEIGMGLGVVIVDTDGDGRPDIYAVNDTTRNFLYRNVSGPGKIRLQDVSLESGASVGPSARPDGSMGVDAADYDGSGRPSLWVTTFERERHALFRSLSAKSLLFEYATDAAGIASLGSGYVGFGTAFIDVDGDGWEDLVIANGHVRRHATRAPLRQKPVLFRNLQNGRFINSTTQGGPYFQAPHRGRGLAVADLDNDGRPDLVITHANEPAVLLRNDPLGTALPTHHWLGLDLAGRDHRDIAGARIVIEAGGRKFTRFAKGGGSYLSASDRRILIGLDTAMTADRVSVHWPWGAVQIWQGTAIDRYWRLIEGEPAPVRVYP